MKKISAFLICVLLILQLFTGMNVFAAEISGNVETKPVDMVVVVDTSGSMNYSDSTHLTAPAIKMLINMIPAENSRLGIVTFNTKPTALTCDSEGNPALLSLKEFENVKNIKQKVSEIAYKSDTGIGNAIKMATDILAEHSKDQNRQKAILLFTDGVDDFPGDQLGLARCKENQGTAVQWATENNCPIYCIGYNYKTASGESSMGKAGFDKLSGISKSTKGKAQAITSIKQIEDMFIKMVAEIYSVIYIPVDVIPGDGLRHEVPITISPEVIEANVRIACPTKEAISKGKIELYNPQNQQVPLQNNGGIRYDVDATAASIKVLSPKTGKWKLVLEGIKGEEIKIGLLEHYELGIVSKLTLPKNNPKDVAYVGDTIGVQASLTTDGKPMADTAIYETVKNAKVVVTPRADAKQQKTYALTFDGKQYVGSFSIPMESAYDVTVEISSDSFVRSDNLVIKSSNHPLVLNKKIENVKLNKKKQLVISDIYTYVSDPENDKITAEVTNSTDPDMANAVVKDDTIVIDGLKWGATNVTVTYTDAHGNTVESTFKVSVNDPVALAIIIGSIVLIVALFVLLVVLAFRSRFYLFGKILVCEISEGVVDIAGNFSRNEKGFSYINPHTKSNTNSATNSGTKPGTPIFAPQKSGGLFSTSNNAPQQNGSGLFGTPNNALQQNGSGLFSTPNNAPQQNGSGLLGSQTPGISGSQTNKLFGTPQSDVVKKNGIFTDNKDNSEQVTGLFGQDTVDTELEISNQYNEAYSFGNRKKKKTTLELILSGFLTKYSDFMSRKLQGKQSSMVEQLKQKLSNIGVQTSKMVLHGTIGGRGGAVLKVNKGILKKDSIKITTPRLEGNKAELPYYKKGVVELDFVVVLDNSGDQKSGIRVRAEFQRK